MGEFIFRIWYMVAILPFLILLEANKAFTAYLKKHDIYHGWNIWHSILVVLIFILVIMLLTGNY